MKSKNKLFQLPPYSQKKEEKRSLYNQILNELTIHHYSNCKSYKNVLDILEFDPKKNEDAKNIPFIPVRLFKDHELLSVPSSSIIKTMKSSGTSGQKTSKIFLDKYTATNQSRVLAQIVANFIGEKRLPLLIIDSKSTIRDKKLFSARGAGILGFSMFGRDVTFALNEDMELDLNTVEKFISKHKKEDILIFGFTFMVWEYFFAVLKKRMKTLNFEKATLIHGGGWKKMHDQSVDNKTFKKEIRKVLNIKKIHNYYGMVEQTGSIFMECEKDFLHTSIFSDVIIRRADFSEAAIFEPGLVQLLSPLPYSYPGHIILTEDVGEICGEDSCKCGRMGKFFKIHGRIENAEVRGCSDISN